MANVSWTRTMGSLDEEGRLQKAASCSEVIEVVRATLDRDGRHRYAHLVGYSAQFLYLTIISDAFDLDGYELLRRADVTSFALEFPRAGFLRQALAVNRVEKPQHCPEIDLTSILTVLRSVDSRFPVVVIEREYVHPGECEIGRLKLTSGDTYALRWLSPIAAWESDPRTFKYADITRISFGGRYETTLAKVADLAI